MQKEYREYLDKQLSISDSTRADQKTIFENFPPIEKLNAKYFLTMIKKKKLSPFTIWKRYGLAKRVLKHHKIECDWSDVKEQLPKLSKIETVTVEDLYTKEELDAIFKACNSVRDRAMLEVLYESAARVSELLSMTIENITTDKNGEVTIIIKGKTGTRIVPLYRSVPALRQWLDFHPVGKGFVWVSMIKGKHTPLSRTHLYQIMRNAVKKAKLKRTKKKLVHMMRHTRITEFVVMGIRGQVLHKLVGWSKRSNMEAVYVHIATHDVINEVREKVFGLEIDREKKKPLLDLKICPTCHTQNDEHTKVCSKCGFPLTNEGLSELREKAASVEVLRSEIHELRKAILRIGAQVFTDDPTEIRAIQKSVRVGVKKSKKTAKKQKAKK